MEKHYIMIKQEMLLMFTVLPAYLVISRANFVLKYINNGVLSGTQKTNLEAEARALRAIAHFDIVRAYS
ncbi:MAG: hypothetical protein E6Q36_01810, partial [Chryseobacterium sp.]